MAKPCAYHNYRSLELKHWVDQKIHREGISRVMVFSSSMAQYANAGGAVRSVIDFVDVDSEKWRQYSRRHRWPLSWVYRREGERLLAYEREVAQWASASVFVTEEEASVFREKAPDLTGSIRSIVNGVDAEFFSPDRSYEKPFSGDEPTIVFTGMMDYWANIDAVDWFARETFPLVRENHQKTRFVIVGARPDRAVEQLASLPGIEVTGRVADVRPYLAHANVVVAPLRVARGIQNKVLEAFAMARPVVATSAAMKGLDIPEALRVHVADDVHGLATRVGKILDASSPTLEKFGRIAREWVQTRHDWTQTLRPVAELIG